MAVKTVLITGANSGVGYATAHALAHAPEGYHILLTSRNLPAAQAAASAILATSPSPTSTITPLQLDVTDESSIAAAASYISANLSSLDTLINNAALGGLSSGPLKQRMSAVLETNVMGPFLVSAAFRPLLLKAAEPRSIFVSSGAGITARAPAMKAQMLPGGEPYCISKAALNMLAMQEHLFYGDQGLKVFAVTPGFIISNLRGKSEEARTGWGKAEEGEAAGRFMLEVVRGKWDGEAGRFISKDRGVQEW